MPKKTIIIDGHNFLLPKFLGRIREASYSHYAIFAVLRSIARVLKFTGADRAVICWDGGKSKRRKKLLPEYKSNRPELEEDLRDDINLALNALSVLLKNMGLRVFPRKQGTEADDLIATICSLVKGQKIIASTDTDFFQLIDEDVVCLNPQKLRYTDAKKLEKALGIKPCQYLEWKSMVGDTSDAIKGVKGVGPKRASKLLTEFPTIAAAKKKANTYHFDKQTSAVFQADELLKRNKGLIDLRKEIKRNRAFVSRHLRKEARFNQKSIERLFGILGIGSLIRDRRKFFSVFKKLK